MSSLRVCVSGLLVLISPVVSPAQIPEPGARVRIRGACAPDEGCRPVIGTFVGVAGDTINMIAENGNPLALSHAHRATMEVSRGSGKRTGLGAANGLAAGAFFGVLRGSACENSQPPEEPSWFDLQLVSPCAYHYVLWPAVGAALGAMIGSVLHVERWEVVDGATGLVRPGANGMQLGLRVAF